MFSHSKGSKRSKSNLKILNMKVDKTIQHWLLCLLWRIFTLVDTLLDLITGVSLISGSRREREKAADYENSAQIVSVIWRAKCAALSVTKITDFLYKHEEYVNPEYVLKHKNATLMAVEKDYALFAISDPSVDVYDSQFSFLVIADFEQAKKLVIIPIKSFHRLADELGDPKVPVAMTAMTTRCGSTLLTQMLNRVPGVRTMSEPWATVNIHELRSMGLVTPEESRKLIKSAIRLHCKIEPDSDVSQIFLKMTALNGPQFVDFGQLFPQFKFFFNTRHPVPSLKSLKTVVSTMKADLYILLGIRWRELVKMKFCVSYDSKYNHMAEGYNRWIPNIPTEALGIIVYSTSILAYFENKDLYDHVILYENLSKNPEAEVTKMFDIMELSHDHIPKALGALKKDSQNGTFVKRGAAKSVVVDPKILDLYNDYMKRMGVPLRHEQTVDEFKAIFGM